MAAIFIFFISAALLVYIIAGYPFVLFLHRRSAPPIRKRFEPRRVSVLIAVHNGETYIRQKLESILNLDYPHELIDVLVVSDGSTDATDRIVEEFLTRGVRLLRVPRGGKPAALNAGIPQVRGEILVLTDVRQALAPDSLRHLIACFADPSVGTASAELQLFTGESQEESDMGLYWKYEVWVRKHMSRIGSIFGASGCYYAIRRELAGPIPADTLIDDVMLPMGAYLRGYRMILEPAAMAYDFPTGLKSEFRRKMRTLAGLWQVFYRVPALLTKPNPMRWHFISLKMGRLVIPYAVIGVTLSAFWLPSPLRQVVLPGLALFYGLGLLDTVLPQKHSVKRVTSPIRTFLVLSAAAFCTVVLLFMPAQRLWKVTSIHPGGLEQTVEEGPIEEEQASHRRRA